MSGAPTYKVYVCGAACDRLDLPLARSIERVRRELDERQNGAWISAQFPISACWARA